MLFLDDCVEEGLTYFRPILVSQKKSKKAKLQRGVQWTPTPPTPNYLISKKSNPCRVNKTYSKKESIDKVILLRTIRESILITTGLFIFFVED